MRTICTFRDDINGIFGASSASGRRSNFSSGPWERTEGLRSAHVGIADAWAQLGWLEFSAPTEAFPKAREAAERALALDDRLAEAHTSLGFVRFLYERDWEAARAEFQRAIALNPGYPLGHQFMQII